MLDPGHDNSALSDHTPFPVGAANMRILPYAGVADCNIVVPAGSTCIISTIPVVGAALAITFPGTAILGSGSNQPATSPFPQVIQEAWTNQMRSLNPGAAMQAMEFNRYRCLGKSITLTNVTPAINQGGQIYTAHFDCPLMNGKPGSTSTVATNSFNHPVVTEYPLTAAQFMASGKYEAFSGREGAYVISRMKNATWDGVDSCFKTMSVHADTTQGATYVANTLVFSSPTDNKSVEFLPNADFLLDNRMRGYWSPLSGVSTVAGTWDNGTQYAHFPVIGDSCESSFIMIQAPADNAQTYHIKYRSALEFTCSAACPLRTLARLPEDDLALAEAIMESMAALPTEMPAEFNGLGKVWEGFKKLWRSKVGLAIRSGVSLAVPKIGGLIGPEGLLK